MNNLEELLELKGFSLRKYSYEFFGNKVREAS
jgi:hypothetical protein